MSIFVSDFDTWTVIHDDAPGGSHTGTIDPATITYTANMDGTENHLFIQVPCPVCGAVSTHPVGGGAQPLLVQEMFVRKVNKDGCVCSEMSTRGVMTAADATAHVKQLVTEMDGADRWQLDDAVLAALA